MVGLGTYRPTVEELLLARANAPEPEQVFRAPQQQRMTNLDLVGLLGLVPMMLAGGKGGARPAGMPRRLPGMRPPGDPIRPLFPKEYEPSQMTPGSRQAAELSAFKKAARDKALAEAGELVGRLRMPPKEADPEIIRELEGLGQRAEYNPEFYSMFSDSRSQDIALDRFKEHGAVVPMPHRITSGRLVGDVVTQAPNLRVQSGGLFTEPQLTLDPREAHRVVPPHTLGLQLRPLATKEILPDPSKYNLYEVPPTELFQQGYPPPRFFDIRQARDFMEAMKQYFQTKMIPRGVMPMTGRVTPDLAAYELNFGRGRVPLPREAAWQVPDRDALRFALTRPRVQSEFGVPIFEDVLGDISAITGLSTNQVAQRLMGLGIRNYRTLLEDPALVDRAIQALLQ